jgi:F-type H+-transporting ATPase subunit b
MIIDIFKQLGVDVSYFYQFAIFCVSFFLLKKTFFNKLQEVLERRESRTTKLAEDANLKISQAEDLSAKYNEMVDVIRVKTSETISIKRDGFLSNSKDEIAEVEDKTTQHVDKEINVYKEELVGKRASLLSTTDTLASELINKLS